MGIPDLSVFLRCAVIDAVDFPDGKFSAQLGNVVILEAAYFGTLLQPLLGRLVPAGQSFQIAVRFPSVI